MRPVTAVAPARLDLAGGTLDLWPIHLALPRAGVTLNVALDLPATAEVTPAPDGRSIRLASIDRDEEVVHDSPEALALALASGEAPLALLGRAVEAVAPEGGLSLSTTSMSPAGAGLGASSSVLVAALAALGAAVGRTGEIEAERLVSLAVDLEAVVLRRPTGFQDFYPPLLGGCLALEGRPGGVHAIRLDVDLEALAARLRLVWTGTPHVSGDTNWNTYRAFFDREPDAVRAIGEIAEAAWAVYDALARGDLDGALEAVVAEGRVRARMAPGVSTPAIEALDQAVRAAGAVGTKILGAGGGGCVLVVLPGAACPDVDAALASGPWQRLPLRLTGEGLRLAG